MTLGPAVQERELDPGVDRPRVAAQDALQLLARLGLLARLDEGGGQEVARSRVARIELDGLLERGHRLPPVLLVVVDRAELQPDPGIPGRRLGEGFDLLLGLLEPPEATEEVGQALEERGVVRVDPDRLPVDGHRFLALLAWTRRRSRERPTRCRGRGRARSRSRRWAIASSGRSVSMATRPRRKWAWAIPRAHRDQPLEHGARLVVLLLVKVLLGEAQVRLRRARILGDDLLDLRLGRIEALLAAVQLGQRHVAPPCPPARAPPPSGRPGGPPPAR